MDRIGIVDIRDIVTKLKRTVEQATFVHQGNILEEHHRGSGFLGLLSYMEHFLPVVVGR